VIFLHSTPSFAALIYRAKRKSRRLLRRLPSRKALLHFRHGGSFLLNYLCDSAQGSSGSLHERKALSERNFLVHKMK
jgi:hypothetical protein